MPIEARCLADFEGRWLLERRIAHEGGAVARFAGHAVWRWVQGGMKYVETGIMTVADAATLEARQEYMWKEDLTVWFSDGRFFHRVPATGGVVSHWCTPDQYDGHYDFGAWPAFSVTWDVSGPRKAYRMTSQYRRA